VDQQGRKGSWETKENFSTVLAEYDRQLGRLFDGLKTLGLETNTLVIFTSDNGPLPSFNHARTGGLRGSKLSLYEGGVRVPFIVRWPGHATAGQVDEQTVLEMVDLFPTLCAIAQGQMPANFTFDGRDMRAAFDSKPAVAARTIFWEYGREKSTSFAYPRLAFDRSPHLAVREGKWKLLVNPDGSDVELFDLEADGYETTNVAAKQIELTNRLKEAALAWKKSLPAYPPPWMRPGGILSE
jgi:arylsulfatase A-like enzyme